jgi:predicted nucleotidyltransferase
MTAPTLPPEVKRVLLGFVEAARAALGADLRSVVLYGSAAEGKLRATSDVNVILVLTAFDPEKADALRDSLRTAHAAIALEAMFLLENELPAAAEAFAVKFADIRHRRHVLYGDDVFAALAPSRGAEISRLQQVTLNLVLRLRQRYLLQSLREEQTVAIVADSAGPLRASAETLLELEGERAESPKAALEAVARKLGDADWEATLARISEARETRSLPPGVGPQTVLRLIELAAALHTRAEALR